MALSECPECSRHVRAGTRVCPFCDHALPASFGRARTSAVLVGAAALTTLTACSRVVATKYGGPPPPPEPDPVEAADAPEPPEDVEVDEAEPESEPESESE